jgi:hypothetical protein
MGEMIGSGYNGSSFTAGASIDFYTANTGTISATSFPSDIAFRITPDGSVSRTEVMRLMNNASLRLNSISSTEYVQLQHNSIDGYLSTSEGNLIIAPADGYTQFIGQVYSELTITHNPIAVTTVDWNQGNSQVVSLGAATGTVTLTLSNPRSGASYVLKVIQHGSAPQNITWPAAVKWPDAVTPTISTGANATDIVTLFYDGEQYYATIGQNFG